MDTHKQSFTESSFTLRKLNVRYDDYPILLLLLANSQNLEKYYIYNCNKVLYCYILTYVLEGVALYHNILLFYAFIVYTQLCNYNYILVVFIYICSRLIFFIYIRDCFYNWHTCKCSHSYYCLFVSSLRLKRHL